MRQPRAMRSKQWGRFITNLFKQPTASVTPPAVPDAPKPPPTIDTAAAQQGEEDMLRKRKGYASTVLVGNGATTQPGGSGVLLGG